ncbi:molybdopterin adenylyltransferase [Sutterella sp.]|uniref:molybdopterin adenylyltransferase n=1 Tax=Sutterella sp. TaxID=1981025 RepID=UPI003FD81BE6
MKPPRSVENELILGLVSVSDRASRGVYEDQGIPALEAWCRRAITTPIKIHKRLIPDERFDIEKTLRELVDIIGCDLILTTGGTGPARRDVTPEATLAVATREMPGFGEQMRAISGHFVPTAILSRQVGVLRETPDHAALILNLPGQPKAIAETLEGLRDEAGRPVVNGIFAAVPYCIDLIGGPYIETDESVVKAFRPKSARRKSEKEAQPQETAPAAPQPETKPAPTPAAAPQREPVPAEETPREARPEVESVEKKAPAPRPEVKREAPRAPAFAPEDILVTGPRTGGTPELTVVWLHGMGVDNTDFAAFPDEIRQFNGPVCRFVLPNAPMREMSMHPDYPLRAWYDVPGRRIDENEDELGIRETSRRVAALIDEIAAEGVPRSRIVLGGFSQGSAISLFTGLRMKEPIGGVAALSGYLPLAGRLFSEATPAGRRTPIFMAHGDFDSVVPPVIAARSAEVIAQVDSDLIARTYPMDHELCREEMHDLAAFLRSVADRAER